MNDGIQRITVRDLFVPLKLMSMCIKEKVNKLFSCPACF